MLSATFDDNGDGQIGKPVRTGDRSRLMVYSQAEKAQGENVGCSVLSTSDVALPPTIRSRGRSWLAHLSGRTIDRDVVPVR